MIFVLEWRLGMHVVWEQDVRKYLCLHILLDSTVDGIDGLLHIFHVRSLFQDSTINRTVLWNKPGSKTAEKYCWEPEGKMRIKFLSSRSNYFVTFSTSTGYFWLSSRPTSRLLYLKTLWRALRVKLRRKKACRFPNLWWNMFDKIHRFHKFYQESNFRKIEYFQFPIMTSADGSMDRTGSRFPCRPRPSCAPIQDTPSSGAVPAQISTPDDVLELDDSSHIVRVHDNGGNLDQCGKNLILYKKFYEYF